MPNLHLSIKHASFSKKHLSFNLFFHLDPTVWSQQTPQPTAHRPSSLRPLQAVGELCMPACLPLIQLQEHTSALTVPFRRSQPTAELAANRQGGPLEAHNPITETRIVRITAICNIEGLAPPINLLRPDCLIHT